VLAIDSPQGARQMSLGLAELDPGSEPPVHRHEVEEGYYVLAGQGFLVLDGEDVPLRPGGFALTPARTWHTIRNTGSDLLKLVIVYAGTDAKVERRGGG